MGQEESPLEIPHSRVANMWMLVPAALPIAVGAGRIYNGAPSPWSNAALIGLGVLLVAGDVWALVVRPPQLRATRAGLWFGGRAIIPWRQVQRVYECVPMAVHRHPVRGT